MKRESTIVYCHLEFLRFFPSQDVYLSQLAATLSLSGREEESQGKSFFCPVAPPGLAGFLEDHNTSQSLLQNLHLIREDNQSRLLFQPAALSKQIEPVRCVS